MGGHSKLPLAALYLECGAVPLRFILMSRRIMYLQTILKRNDSELIKKIYKAQKHNTRKGDFVELVKDNMKELELNETEEEIENMTKMQLKSKIKIQVEKAALKYLNLSKSSKMKPLVYTKIEMQQYLKSRSFAEEEASLLLAMRTRTVRGIRCDFPGMFPTRECPMVGCREEDTLPHLFTCTVLLAEVQEVQEVQEGSVMFTHIYTGTVEQQKKVTTRARLLLEARQRMEEGIPAAQIAGSRAPSGCNIVQCIV